MTDDPMKEWVLRDEILAATHRWPIIVLFAMAGALLALAAVYLWPSAYRANTVISVELNPYRVLDDQYLTAFTKAEFRNVDDYKHWQMLQLSIVVKSDIYMTETLDRLREIDPYWDSVDIQELRQMLSADWRNAGLWLLSAEVDTESRAVDAVETWRDVIINLTEETIANSQSLFELELALRSLNDQLVENQLQITLLMETSETLVGLRGQLQPLDENAVPSEEYHQELLMAHKQMTQLLPGEYEASSNFPEANSTVDKYFEWIDPTILLAENHILSLQLKDEIIKQEIKDVTALWEAGLQGGQGLSATLNIENRQNSETEVRQIRPYGLTAIIGSLVGLLLWVGLFILQITRKGYQ